MTELDIAQSATRTYAAWQFVRRNKRYRADYVEFNTVKVELEAKYGPVSSWTAKMLWNEPQAWHYTPSKNAEESDRAWRIRAVCAGHEPLKALIHKGYGRKWGLIELVDPDQTSIDGVAFQSPQAPPIWHRSEDVEASPLEDGDGIPRSIYVRLDGAQSVTKQLAALRRTLIAKQRLLKKEGLSCRSSLHPEKWPLYWKVLDGFAVGKSAKDLAQSLFPHIDDKYPEYRAQARVRDTHQQALTLVNGGYRYILESEG